MKLLEPHEHLAARPGIGARQWAVFGAVFAAAGVAVVLVTSAAGTPVAFEAESGTLAGGATVTSMAGQSGSGAVKFGAGATPTPTPHLRRRPAVALGRPIPPAGRTRGAGAGRARKTRVIRMVCRVTVGRP